MTVRRNRAILIQPGPDRECTGWRISAAVRLYREGGWTIASHPEIAPRILDDFGIPIEDFNYLPESRSTTEDVWVFRERLLKRDRIDEAAIVSSHWHGPRVSYIAGKLLGNDYNWKFHAAPDFRPRSVVEADVRRERMAMRVDQLMLNLPFGTQRPDAYQTLKEFPKRFYEVWKSRN